MGQMPQFVSNQLPVLINKGDMDGAIKILKTFIDSIPYDIRLNFESYYRTTIDFVFAIHGINCRSDVHIAVGRIDMLVETNTAIYCFEFKLGKTAQEALEEIDRKEYLLPWTMSGKKLYKVGVIFDHATRNIGDWKIAQYIWQRKGD